MNIYEINWQEVTIKSVTVMGNTREEAWEAFKSNCYSKPKTKSVSKDSPGIQLVNKGETNDK
jgi:hypothetical protein